MSPLCNAWKEQRTVESYDVDIAGRLRPQALFACLLNSAWNHARGTSYGYEELSARNLMWVLIKVQILIRRLPRWGEDVAIETWGKRIERLYALRDFAVTTAAGDALVSATSSWLVLDKTSGRPQRFDPRADGFPWQPGRQEMETSLEKVPQPVHATELARFRVQFSDIDVNRHVNSAKYLQWMIDSHAHEALEAAWQAAPALLRDLYRGILQVGVVYLHITQYNYPGAIKVYQRCRKWLLLWPETCRGVEVGRLRQDLEAVITALQALGPQRIIDFNTSLLKPVHYR